MKNFLFLLVVISFSLPACRSKIKQQEDSIYSRHLQRHIELTVITTPMPKNKEEMNLLLFNEGEGGTEVLKQLRVKKIIDSLYSEKKIQPLVVVAFGGSSGDFGLEEADVPEAGGYKKFNDFVDDELYPFIKKRVVIRKFNSVAIFGTFSGALSSFDIARNHDNKIQKAGMEYPIFFLRAKIQDSVTLDLIRSSRKKPKIDYWVTGFEDDTAVATFANIISKQTPGAVLKYIPVKDNRVHIKTDIPETKFADFIVWAFPK